MKTNTKKKPTARRPARFNWGREMGKALEEAMPGEHYIGFPKQLTCRLIAAVVRELGTILEDVYVEGIDAENKRLESLAPCNRPHAVAIASTGSDGDAIEYHVAEDRTLAEAYAKAFNDAAEKGARAYVAIVTPDVPAAALAKFEAEQRAEKRKAERLKKPAKAKKPTAAKKLAAPRPRRAA